MESTRNPHGLEHGMSMECPWNGPFHMEYTGECKDLYQAMVWPYHTIPFIPYHIPYHGKAVSYHTIHTITIPYHSYHTIYHTMVWSYHTIPLIPLPYHTMVWPYHAIPFIPYHSNYHTTPFIQYHINYHTTPFIPSHSNYHTIHKDYHTIVII